MVNSARENKGIELDHILPALRNPDLIQTYGHVPSFAAEATGHSRFSGRQLAEPLSGALQAALQLLKNHDPARLGPEPDPAPCEARPRGSAWLRSIWRTLTRRHPPPEEAGLAPLTGHGHRARHRKMYAQSVAKAHGQTAAAKPTPVRPDKGALTSAQYITFLDEMARFTPALQALRKHMAGVIAAATWDLEQHAASTMELRRFVEAGEVFLGGGGQARTAAVVVQSTSALEKFRRRIRYLRMALTRADRNLLRLAGFTRHAWAVQHALTDHVVASPSPWADLENAALDYFDASEASVSGQRQSQAQVQALQARLQRKHRELYTTLKVLAHVAATEAARAEQAMARERDSTSASDTPPSPDATPHFEDSMLVASMLGALEASAGGARQAGRAHTENTSRETAGQREYMRRPQFKESEIYSASGAVK